MYAVAVAVNLFVRDVRRMMSSYTHTVSYPSTPWFVTDADEVDVRHAMAIVAVWPRTSRFHWS